MAVRHWRPPWRTRRLPAALVVLCCAAGLSLPAPGAVSALFTVNRQVGGNTLVSRNSFGVTQLAGTAACTSDDGTGGSCVDGVYLKDVAGIAVTSDGAYVYAVDYGGAGGVLAFSRNAGTGALTQLASPKGCYTNTSQTNCTLARAVASPWNLALSPDDKYLYAASYGSNAVAVFQRNTSDGSLTQLATTSGCVSTTTGGCAAGTALGGASGIAVSPDGLYLYVASYNDNAVAAFQRNTSTGVLTQLGGTTACMNNTGGSCTAGKGFGGAVDVQVSPDNASVYVAGYTDNAIAILSRNTGTGVLSQSGTSAGCYSMTGNSGACGTIAQLGGPYSITVSPDNTNVYVTGYDVDSVVAFSRTPGASALTQLASPNGCIVNTATGGCTTGTALDGTTWITSSPDGQDVYVASHLSNAVAIFKRDPTTGVLTQWSGTRGCVSQAGGSCATGTGLNQIHSVKVTPDGKDLYVGSGYTSGSVFGFVDAFARSR